MVRHTEADDEGTEDENDTVVIRTDDGIIHATVDEVVECDRPEDGARLGGTLDADDPSVHYVDYHHADDGDDEPEFVERENGDVKCPKCKKYAINEATLSGHKCPADEADVITSFDEGDRVEFEYEDKSSKTDQTKRGTVTSIGARGTDGATMCVEDVDGDDRKFIITATGTVSTSRDGKHLATVSRRADVLGIESVDE